MLLHVARSLLIKYTHKKELFRSLGETMFSRYQHRGINRVFIRGISGNVSMFIKRFVNISRKQILSQQRQNKE